MPIKIPNELPAAEILRNENIFVMDENRANSQDIRAFKVVILNLMPTKITTETQLLRLLGNTPVQVEITLLRTSTHQSKNTPEEHLLSFYKTIHQVRDQKFDALIITGAPVELLPFEEVDYWEELKTIMDWGLSHVYSLFYICWGAQAALYHQFGIPKYTLPEKKFGVYRHQVLQPNIKLFRGFDDVFYAPHSRHTEIRHADIEKHPELLILSDSDEAGVYIVVTRDGRQVFVTGHSEYGWGTLKKEYERDVEAHLPIKKPVNYYPEDNPSY